MDKYVLKLLKTMKKGEAMRFNDLRAFIKNPNTLTAKLKLLQELGIVKKDGSSYKLTNSGERVADKIREVEMLLYINSKIESIERVPHASYSQLIRRFCELLYEKFDQRLLSVVLFGSVARGNWSENSDIDLLIVVEGWEGKAVWERVRELRAVERRLEKSSEYLNALRAGYTPLIQPYPLDPYEAKKFNKIYLDLVIDGIIIYDKDEFIERIMDSLRKELEKIGAKKITLPNGQHYWILKEVEVGEVVKLG